MDEQRDDRDERRPADEGPEADAPANRPGVGVGVGVGSGVGAGAGADPMGTGGLDADPLPPADATDAAPERPSAIGEDAEPDAPSPGLAAKLSTPPPTADNWAPPAWADADRASATAARTAETGAGPVVGTSGPAPVGARRSVRMGTLAFGVAFVVLGVLGLLEPLDVDFETVWLWAVAPVALGLATMVAVIRRSLANGG